MPKRAPHGRPAKSKNRARRPATGRPAPPGGGTIATPVQDPGVAVGSETGMPVRAVASTAARAPATTGPRRVASSARRAPAVTFSYAYLSHDIRYLGLLAPAMVVLLILAYIFLH